MANLGILIYSFVQKKFAMQRMANILPEVSLEIA